MYISGFKKSSKMNTLNINFWYKNEYTYSWNVDSDHIALFKKR